MKFFYNLIMVTAIVFASVFKMSAQDKFADYTNTYLNESYKIEISLDSKDNSKYTLYVDAYSLDKLITKAGIMIDQKQHDDFINALKTCKQKYEEWTATAKSNNVKDLDKKIDVKSIVGGYFNLSGWKYQFRVPLTFYYNISQIDGKLYYVLKVYSGTLTASDNEFEKCDGVILTFESAESIQSFIDLVSTEKIDAYKKSKTTQQDLFK